MDLFGVGRKVVRHTWKDLVKKHLRQGHSLKESLRLAKSEYKRGL